MEMKRSHNLTTEAKLLTKRRTLTAVIPFTPNANSGLYEEAETACLQSTLGLNENSGRDRTSERFCPFDTSEEPYIGLAICGTSPTEQQAENEGLTWNQRNEHMRWVKQSSGEFLHTHYSFCAKYSVFAWCRWRDRDNDRRPDKFQLNSRLVLF
jgi:hypothetical protein